MARARERGTRRFSLGATPAGKPLYDRVGHRTSVVTALWAAGETAQA